MVPRQVAEEVGRLTGRTPSRSTVTKWITDGVGGHYLRATRVGGVNVVTHEDLRLFLAAVNGS